MKERSGLHKKLLETHTSESDDEIVRPNSNSFTSTSTSYMKNMK